MKGKEKIKVLAKRFIGPINFNVRKLRDKFIVSMKRERRRKKSSLRFLVEGYYIKYNICNLFRP